MVFLKDSSHKKTIVINIVKYWFEDRHTDQCNRTENLEINPFNFDRDIKTIQCGKNNL